MLLPAVALLAASTACTPPSRPLLAEVFYDAAGDDTGHEFVELVNPGATPFALAGLRLEAGDGSSAGRWTLRWTGGAGDTVPPGARFVIGGAAVVPAPHAIAALDLQNGPDAVRLVWPDGMTEVVGYGTHEFAEYFCVEPAPDVVSGQSLARTPDDSDAGGNRADFRAAAPSPGAANVSSRNAALAPGTLRVLPERPDPAAAITIVGGVTNPGREEFAAGEVAIRAEARSEGGAFESLGEVALAAAIAPGDSVAFAFPAFAPAEGKWRVIAAVTATGDQNARDDGDTTRLRVGRCPLELSEVQFHPAAGEGEWVEVRSVHAAGDPAAFTISDLAGTLGRPESGRLPLARDSLGVLAQDRRALLARFSELDTTRVWESRPWPSLNNRDEPSGIADAVALREADGTPCDRLEYSASGLPDGVPLEHRDGGWWPSRRAGGTPLEPPRAPVPPAGRFAVEPRFVRRGAAVTRCRWMLPWPRARVRFEIFDLAGRRVPGGAAEFLAPAVGERDLSLADLPPGLYAIALRARAESGVEEIVELRPLRIAGVAP